MEDLKDLNKDLNKVIIDLISISNNENFLSECTNRLLHLSDKYDIPYYLIYQKYRKKLNTIQHQN